MKIVAKMADNQLDPAAPLFKVLMTDPPVWWEILKNDPELYIDIRKGNMVMAYYQGGRVASIAYKRGLGVSAKIHPKYIGADSDKEQEIAHRLDSDFLKVIKANIETYYSQRSDEDIQEKRIQGECVINNRNIYLDSEFAHRQYKGQSHTVRIDLIKIIDDEIIFEELKKINDARLHTSKGRPEIIQQMNAYREFLEENYKTLETYYKTLLQIKINLGLPTPLVPDVDRLHVRVEPELTIFNTYPQTINKRADTIRNKRINSIMNELQGYDYKIIKYRKQFYLLPTSC